MKQVTDPKQTRYVKGRLAAHNVRLAKDIVAFLLKRNVTGATITVCFAAALDVMECFSPSFRK